MSSSEGENFDLDVSDSEEEDYAPVKKVRILYATDALANPQKTTTKAASKVAAAKPKAAPTKSKAKPAPKKKILVDHDDNEESGSDFELRKDASEDEQPKAGTSNLQPERKKKTASETYTKVCPSNSMTYFV